MRSIGAAQQALDLMLDRVTDPARKTFGKHLYEHGKLHFPGIVVLFLNRSSVGTVIADLAKSRAEIESARLLVLSAALQIDKFKAKGALKEIGIAKVLVFYVFSTCLSIDGNAMQFVVPSMALQVVDRAMQSFGAEGVSQDTPLAQTWAGLRTLRFADVSFSISLCATSRIDIAHYLGSRCCESRCDRSIVASN